MQRRALTCAASVTDQATDRVGLGDKYDDKINKFTDSQTNKQVRKEVTGIGVESNDAY